MVDQEEITVDKELLSMINLDESSLEKINKFPIKILYKRQGTDFSNIIIFEEKDKLLKFLRLRKYLIDHSGKDREKMSHIRLFE